MRAPPGQRGFALRQDYGFLAVQYIRLCIYNVALDRGGGSHLLVRSVVWSGLL